MPVLRLAVVAVSPASAWRVLKQAGLLSRSKGKPSRKGTGFEQPLQPHQHWHIDIAYINVCGTFYCLCSVLDGYSRFIVHWDLRESLRETDIEVILECAKEKHRECAARHAQMLAWTKTGDTRRSRCASVAPPYARSPGMGLFNHVIYLT
jgi:transposase InsO family protein